MVSKLAVFGHHQWSPPQKVLQYCAFNSPMVLIYIVVISRKTLFIFLLRYDTDMVIERRLARFSIGYQEVPVQLMFYECRLQRNVTTMDVDSAFFNILYKK